VANIPISIPDNMVQRVQDAFAGSNGYQDTVPDAQGAMIPNPETKQAFTQRMIREYVKGVVSGYEGRKANETAAQAARDAVG
jgi:hypothetical protein